MEIAAEQPFSARLVKAAPCRLKGPGWLVLNSPVISMKWEHLSSSEPNPGPNTAQSIIDRRSPFNQRDTSIAYMRDLYPTNLRIRVVALSNEYSVPFPNYLNKDKKQMEKILGFSKLVLVSEKQTRRLVLQILLTTCDVVIVTG